MSMKVEQTNIDELIPYASNSRTHSEEQVAQIAASIKEFGFNNPVLLDGDNGIIAGHGRTLAARKLGLKEVPTIELAHLSDSQRKAYIIADNKLALNAGWDMPTMALELHGLNMDGFDLSLTGFSDIELENILDPMSDDFSASEEWGGMPEFSCEDKTAFKSVVVHFKDQGAIDAFASVTGLKVLENTRMAWYPDIEIETYADKLYDEE